MILLYLIGVNRMVYSKEDVPSIEQRIIQATKLAEKCERENFHKSQYSKSNAREVGRLKKLKKFVSDDRIEVADYANGLIIIDDTYIVSLASNKWRVAQRDIWYRHKPNVQHFIDNYVLKDRKDEIFNT